MTNVSRNKSAKALRLICSFFMATSVKIICSGCTPWATASVREQNSHLPVVLFNVNNLTHENIFITAKRSNEFLIHARSLISPAAGNLRSQSALFGTRLRILHLIPVRKHLVR